MSGDRKTEWCDQEELAVGWAMHALEPDEEAQLRAHLPECATCRRTVRNTEEVTAGSGVGAERPLSPNQVSQAARVWRSPRNSGRDRSRRGGRAKTVEHPFTGFFGQRESN